MQIRRRFITMTTLGMLTFSLAAAPVSTGAEEGGSMGFSLCDGYVYVYSDMDRNSEIVGKLYTDSYVDILEELEYDWTHIASGNVDGYVDSTAIKKGKKARKLARQYGYTTAVVQVDELVVRAKKRETSDALAVVNSGDVLEVVKKGDEWVKVVLVGEDGDLIYGWVSAQYVTVNTEYRLAVTMEEDELGLIDIGEEETEDELEEGADEEIYDDDEYYEEPSYEQPSYTEPSYNYTQPETQAQTQPQTQAPTEAAQPQTQAPTEAAQPDTQPSTDAPADPDPVDEGGDEIYEDPGEGSDGGEVIDEGGDDIYEDDGSGDEVYDDDIFNDEFYDAG